MKSISMKAYAKVNLALDVLRRREDGYHEVRMIMQNLDICDELSFSVKESSDFSIKITTNRDDIPVDSRNLVFKAVALMCEEYGIKAAIDVKLTKNIPVEAGMAGGSTDCAAALKAVNMLFNLGADEKRLMELGVKLGADVPYCVMARTALSEGIGEVLTDVNSLPDCYVLVVKPPVSVSTKMVYTSLNVSGLKRHPDIDGMIAALKEKDLKGVASRMENVLETVTAELHPEIEAIKGAMKKLGALNAIMSGSGPTVFGLYDAEESVLRAADYIRDKGYSKEIFVARPVSGLA